jgi:hypothetical protein
MSSTKAEAILLEDRTADHVELSLPSFYTVRATPSLPVSKEKELALPARAVRPFTKTLVPPGETSRTADSSAKPFCPILPCHEEAGSPGPSYLDNSSCKEFLLFRKANSGYLNYRINCA